MPIVWDKTNFRQRLHSIMIEEAMRQGVSPVELMRPTRAVAVVRARHWMWWRMHHEVGMAYKKIARFMNKDHTTIMHGVQKIWDLIDWESTHVTGNVPTTPNMGRAAEAPRHIPSRQVQHAGLQTVRERADGARQAPSTRSDCQAHAEQRLGNGASSRS